MYNSSRYRKRQPSGQNRNRFSQNRGKNRRSAFARSIDTSQLVKKSTAIADNEVYVPTHSFSDFDIPEALKKNIASKGYVTPTPIQDQAIPHILEGKDLIGIANTGTGKTAAFLIPLINKVLLNPDHESVLIVAPTRELAMQIYDEFRAFSQGLGVYGAQCIGGANMGHQISELRRNPHFVIGTPGRLKDHINSRHLDLSKFHTVVLDEADLMVDIGFISDIKFFISFLPRDRQSLFFSATISGKVKEVLDQFVKNPVTVSVKKQDTVELIDQDVVRVHDQSKKVEVLHDLLIKDEFEKVLIFGRTKWGIQKLTDELLKRGFKAGAIHGNKRQNQRQKTLDQFQNDEISILLATDVASRGIDIENVSHVINYDMPASYDDYIHRIGRTGRAGKTGIALTFVD